MLYLLASYVARKRRAEEVRDSQLTRVGRLRVSQAPGFRRTACAPGRVTLIPRVGYAGSWAYRVYAWSKSLIYDIKSYLQGECPTGVKLYVCEVRLRA